MTETQKDTASFLQSPGFWQTLGGLSLSVQTSPWSTVVFLGFAGTQVALTSFTEGKEKNKAIDFLTSKYGMLFANGIAQSCVTPLNLDAENNKLVLNDLIPFNDLLALTTSEVSAGSVILASAYYFLGKLPEGATQEEQTRQKMRQNMWLAAGEILMTGATLTNALLLGMSPAGVACMVPLSAFFIASRLGWINPDILIPNWKPLAPMKKFMGSTDALYLDLIGNMSTVGITGIVTGNYFVGASRIFPTIAYICHAKLRAEQAGQESIFRHFSFKNTIHTTRSLFLSIAIATTGYCPSSPQRHAILPQPLAIEQTRRAVPV